MPEQFFAVYDILKNADLKICCKSSPHTSYIEIRHELRGFQIPISAHKADFLINIFGTPRAQKLLEHYRNKSKTAKKA